jgi:hypothetical protein
MEPLAGPEPHSAALTRLQIGMERPKEARVKIYHRGTEYTEGVVFSLAGRRRPGKRASASGESS